MPSIIPTSEKVLSRCAKKTFPTSQIHMNLIVEMREGKSKLFLQLPLVVLLVEDQTANGPAQDHRLMRGKTGIEGTGQNVVHQVWNGHLEAGTISVHLTTIKGHHRRHLQESEGRLGAMAQLHGMPIILPHQEIFDTPCQTYLVMAPMGSIGAAVLPRQVMYTYHPTMALGDHASPMTDSDEAQKTQVTLGTDRTKIDRTEVEATAIGTGTAQVTPEVLVGSEGMGGPAQGALSEGTETATIEMMTSTGGARISLIECHGEGKHQQWDVVCSGSCIEQICVHTGLVSVSTASKYTAWDVGYL